VPFPSEESLKRFQDNQSQEVRRQVESALLLEKDELSSESEGEEKQQCPPKEMQEVAQMQLFNSQYDRECATRPPISPP